MLKVIPQQSADMKVPRGAAQGFALVRTSAKSKWAVMTLPLTIGSQTDSDIVVNAPTMRGVSKIALVEGGEVILVEAQTLERSVLSDLKLFGIEILGPFVEDPSKLSGWRRSLSLALNRENHYFNKGYPKALCQFLPQDQTRRLGVVAFALVVTLALFAAVPDAGTPVPDLSTTAIAGKHGNIVKLGIQSSNAGTAYAKGVTIAFSSVEPGEAKQHVLTINASGLDLANELSVQINGIFLGSTAAQLSCVDSFCALNYAIPMTALNPNGNLVHIVHNAPESSYELKNIFFRTMEPAMPEELELMQQLLSSAERYHDERFLLVQNIRNAMDAVDEIERLLATRTGIDGVKPKFSVTKAKVQRSFQDISSDLQFKLQKELKLNHTKLALILVNEMLKLYPDPSTRQNSMLMQQKRKLEEVSTK